MPHEKHRGDLTKKAVPGTTLAGNLAVAAKLQDVPTVLIDLDPQSSAKTWYDIRMSKEAPFVISSQASRLE